MENKCLHPEMMKQITEAAHTEMICVSDYRFPVKGDVAKIELAWKQNDPSWIDVCKMVRANLPIEKIIVANELKEKNPVMHEEFVKEFSDIQIEYISHETFKSRSNELKCSIRTAEFSSFCNCYFVVGVEY